MGGVARRQAFIELFKTYYRDTPYLHVDTGYYFADVKDAQKKRLTDESMLRNTWVLRAFQQMGMDVLNVSFRDLDQLAALSDLTPYGGRLVSANVLPRDRRVVRPEPFIVRELRGGRSKNRSLRVGIIGLTVSAGDLSGKYDVEDPESALARVLPQVRKRADYVLVMAFMDAAAIEKMVSRHPEIDAVIGNVGLPIGTQEKNIGKTIVTYSIYESKFLGEIRIYVDDKGRPAKSVGRYIGLGANMPDDPVMERLRVEARKQIGAPR